MIHRGCVVQLRGHSDSAIQPSELCPVCLLALFYTVHCFPVCSLLYILLSSCNWQLGSGEHGNGHRHLNLNNSKQSPNPGLRFPFPRNSRAMAKNFTSRGISAGFPRVSAGFSCRSHKGTAKFPSRKSRPICKKFPFRGNSAEFPAGNRT